MEQVCVQPRFSAVNMTLPAFAAVRRAAAPLLLSAGACRRSISPARMALSSKLAARRCCFRSIGQSRAYSKEFFGVHNFKSSCMM